MLAIDIGCTRQIAGNDVAVSVFDRWLGEDLSALDFSTEAEYKKRNAPLDCFNESLINSTEALQLGPDYENPRFFDFASRQAAQTYCRQSASDAERGQFFRLVLPDLKTVYLESWDFTNVIYMRDPDVLPVFQGLADGTGVHLLEWEERNSQST